MRKIMVRRKSQLVTRARGNFILVQRQVLIHILKRSPIENGNIFLISLPKCVHAVFQITYRHDIMICLFLFYALSNQKIDS